MEEKNYNLINNNNNCWNPLNYTQNLCVVNANNTSRHEITADENPFYAQNQQQLSQELAQSFSKIDMKNEIIIKTNTDSDYIDINDDINKLITDLIDSNPTKQTAFQSSQSYGLNAFIGDNINVKTDNHSLVLTKNPNAFDSGDSAVDTISKYDYQSNGVSDSQLQSTFYNFNSTPMIQTNEVLKQNYNELKSFPKQNRFYNAIPQQIPHQFTEQLMQNTSQSSQVNQPSVRPKSQNQSYHPFMTYTDQIKDTSTQATRQMRSIRSRNAVESVHTVMEPMNKVNYFLERCFEQLKHLERERKKVEFELSHVFSGQKISSANNIPIQRPPQNATKMDRLITEMSREHAKVITILAKMEQLRGNREFTENIHNTVQNWLQFIRKLQMLRKDELFSNNSNFTNGLMIGKNFVEEVSETLKELKARSRVVRTSLWCSYVLTLY